MDDRWTTENRAPGLDAEIDAFTNKLIEERVAREGKAEHDC